MQSYERHFGFREPPFSLTPDPRFFYATPAYREAYATLRYGVEARKGFVLVSGEAGTGKTTLLRMLMQEANSNVHTAFICNPPGNFTELLRLIMNELELPESSSDRVSITAQFNDYLLDQLRQDHIVSLLVDEAQNLSQEMLEELRLLSNFETHNAKLIQMVLMGQPELEQKLEKPELRQLKQRVALRCCLRPLRPEEVAPYIEFRLAVAGHEGQGLFDRDSVQNVALYSNGIPRLINVLCDNALLLAFDRGAGRVSVDIIDAAARGLCLGDPRLGTPSTTNSGARGAHFSIAGTAPVNGVHTGAPLQQEMLASQFLRRSPDRGTETSAELVAAFRKHRKARVVAVGLWWVAIGTLAVAGAMFYVPKNQQLLAPLVDDQQKSPAPAPHADFAADGQAVNETPLLRPYDSSTTDDRDPIDPEPDRRFDPGANAAAAPSKPLANNESTDGIPPQSGENKSTRRGVRLDLKRVVRAPARRNGQHASGVFNVVGPSFVREKPSAGAEITATLEPGTQVQVVSKIGDYFRVRALDQQGISGYVHREDAFFEPAR